MMLRTIVRDGLIVVNTHGELPDGTRVVIVRDDRPRQNAKKIMTPAKRATKKKAARRAKRGPLSDPILKVFGMWKDRPEWKGKSSAQIARDLRESVYSRSLRNRRKREL